MRKALRVNEISGTAPGPTRQPTMIEVPLRTGATESAVASASVTRSSDGAWSKKRAKSQ